MKQVLWLVDKIAPYVIPISVIIGVVISEYIITYAWLIPWIFAFMTFAGSINSNFSSFKDVILHPFSIFLAMITLHIIMPLFALGMGHIFYSGNTYIITGLVLALAIPTGITSFVWVAICKGNNALALTVILLDSILSPLIVPFTLQLLVGGTVQIDSFQLMVGLFWMIVVPSIVGMLLNEITKGKILKVSATLGTSSKIGLSVVVMLNGAVVAPYLVSAKFNLFGLGCLVFFLAVSGYFVAYFVAKISKQRDDHIIALTFLGGMRNISTGVVLATSFFPPLVALPVVLGMLFQQVIASFFGRFFQRSQANERYILKEGDSHFENH